MTTAPTAQPEWRVDTWIADGDSDHVEYGIFRHDSPKPSMTFATKDEAEAEAARLNVPIPAAPSLIIVHGPWGSGKTTLANALGREVGCPVVARDEIKEGMFHAVRAASADFTPGVHGDPLSVRTLHAFSDVLRLYALAKVSVVAEAAFQDHLWRYVLEPVTDLVALRLVRCNADPTVAFERARERLPQATRAAHAAHEHVHDLEMWKRDYAAFEPLSLTAPSIEVDTTDAYTPSLADVAAFVNDADDRAR